MDDIYFSAIIALKIMKKRFLMLVGQFLKKENDNLKIDQALILYYIGERALSMKEVFYSGVYDGTNPSYSIHSMIKKGYLVSHVCPKDMRVTLVSNTEKGRLFCQKMKRFLQDFEKSAA
jgi:DNA-binding MarR family transcriptional regulator